MKISVIIPIYKTEKYLTKCLNSVLKQTLKDIEIILIDDGSPDNSSVLCKKYVKKDKRIRYFYQKNAGVSAARNFGLKKSYSEFIFFMDSDDFLNDLFFLEKAYNKAMTTNTDIVVLGEYFKNRLPYPPALPGWGFLLKRSFWLMHPDIVFPVGIQPCEDGLFSHQLLALTNKVSFESNVSYFYRQHENSNTSHITKQCGDLLSQVPNWFSILINFYNKNNLWERKAKHLLKFLEHEPFELRFWSMPFTQEQYEILFTIIHTFYNNRLKKYISKEDLKSTSRIFQLFLASSNYSIFKQRLKKILIKKNIKLYFSKFIPLAKIRHRLRNKIQAEILFFQSTPLWRYLV